jgi:hypothetical protein
LAEFERVFRNVLVTYNTKKCVKYIGNCGGKTSFDFSCELLLVITCNFELSLEKHVARPATKCSFLITLNRLYESKFNSNADHTPRKATDLLECHLHKFLTLKNVLFLCTVNSEASTFLVCLYAALWLRINDENYRTQFKMDKKSWYHRLECKLTNSALYFSYRLNLIHSIDNWSLLARHGDIESNPGPKGISGKLLIGSYNISGCKKYSKLRRIVAWIFKHKKTDRFIFSLQETYITKDEVSKVELLWREGLIISPSLGRARGVLTFYSNSLFDNILYSHGSPDGRLTIVIGEYNSNVEMFVSIYSPNSGKNAEFYTSFFSKINKLVLKYCVENVYISGDFNLVLFDAPGSRLQSSYERKLSKIVIDEMNLLGLKCVNDVSKHTWNRGSKVSTLDYIFLPNHICDTSPSCNVNFGVDHSDHASIHTVISFDLDKGRGMFKPNLAFLECVDFRTRFEAELYLSMLDTNPDWNPHMKLEYAKVMIRSKTLEFSIKYNKKIDDKHGLIIAELDKLHALLQSLNSDPNHPLLSHITPLQVESDLFSLNLELDKILKSKTTILAARSRIKWLEYGEKSNKYFLNLNKSYQNSSYFKSFQNDSGAEIFESKGKVDIVHNFYSNLYRFHQNDDSTSFLSKIHVRPISDQDNSILKASLTKGELGTILKACGDTASGPDGIGYKLLKTCWSFYGDMLINSWNYANEIGLLAPSHRDSVICLLGKKGKDKRLVGNLRPITLSNCDIKIITKAITKRCNKILHNVLNPHQTAYIPGRIVHDNLRVISLAKKACGSTGLEGYLVSLDAKKAFDSVDHDFIDKVLVKFHFCNEFRSTVRLLYNKISSRVLVNGHLTEEFQIQRSVKQGDALSCVLFILCMETVIMAIEHDSEINGIRVKDVRFPKVLAFADDIAILVADKSSISKCINNYNNFSLVSGLFLNVDKTEILNLCQFNTDEIISVEQSDIKLAKEVTICGKTFSVDDKIEHDKNVSNKIEKLTKALSLWGRRSLSIFGRNLVLKTFGLSQIIYSMQSSSFLDSDLELIDKICFNFLWNKKAEKTKAYERISRINLKKDSSAGGISAPDVFSMYKALSLKQILRSTADSCSHSIKLLQCDLIGLNSEQILQNTNSKFSDPYLKSATNGLSDLCDVIINEILQCNEESRISKHYYNIVASENLVTLVSKMFHDSIIVHYAKCLKKSLGICLVGHLINEYKFPSTDKFKHMVTCVISSNKIFKILAARKELSYGTSFRDYFPINTNNFVSCDKVTTKSLRLIFFNKRIVYNKIDNFNLISNIMHPKEKEIIYFELHNVLLTNKKLFEMKLRDLPLCELCLVEQSQEHIFMQCSNAVTSAKVYNDLLPTFANSSLMKSNVSSLIKRMLFLNKNKRLSEDVFKIAILDRIQDINKILAFKEKRKNLSVINKVTLG